MKTKLILTKINEFSDIIKNIFQDKEFSDDVKDILQVLSLSSNWIYYNIIFAEENISEWEVDGKIINDLKEEFKKSPDYSISKIKMDKSLLQIYTHFFIIIDSGSRISFPILEIELNDKYISNLYKNPYNYLKENIDNDKILGKVNKSIFYKIIEIRNFRNHLIHYHTWFSTVVPSENIDILISKLYREEKGISFWEENGKTILYSRDFNSGSIEKYGENYKSDELIDLKKMLKEDFDTLKEFMNNIIRESISNLDVWFREIEKYFK